MSSLQNKIGIGTVQFGLNYGISNKHGQTEFAEVKDILDFASQHGITILDTAQVYGDSELILGKCGISGRFKIVSKFMPSTPKEGIDDQFQHSCEKLRTSQLYAYLAHRPLNLLENKMEWHDLQKLKREGKINKIGFSLNTVSELEKLLAIGFFPDIIQVPYNYFDKRFESLMIGLKSEGVEIHTRSAFLQGLFFTDTSRLPVFFDEVKPVIQQLQNLYGSKLSRMLLKHVLAKPFIDTVIIGVENKMQLQENMAEVEDAGELPDMDLEIAQEILVPSNWKN